ncbi:MAG: hypothetical protein ABEH43_00095 [Flavobacteriales bacterium]
MQKNQKIEFDVHRNFNDTISIAFAFLRQNFRLLFKSVIYICGPLILVLSIVSSLLFKRFFGSIFQSIGNQPGIEPDIPFDIGVNFILEYFLIILVTLASYIVMYATVLNFMMIYEKKGVEEIIRVKEVWEKVKEDFMPLLKTMLLLMLLFTAVFVIIGVIVAALMFVPGINVLVILALIPLILYIFYLNNAIFAIRVREKLSTMDCILKAFNIAKGKDFWWSVLLSLVVYFITNAVSMVAYIPFYIFYIILMLTYFRTNNTEVLQDKMSLWFAVFMVFAYVVGIMVMILPIMIIAFHTYSLTEKQEGKGLSAKIAEIGKGDTYRDIEGH